MSELDLDDLPPAQVFGTWDAPIVDDAVKIDVPTGLVCVHCREAFREGDNGAIMPTGFAEHRECGLRAVMGGIGHLVDHLSYCKSELGPDAGLSYRRSALLVWGHYTGKHLVTFEELEELRMEGLV